MNFSKIPIEIIENIKVNNSILNGEFNIPVATFEKTLFKSLKRGALISRKCGGIFVSTEEKIMTRSIILEFQDLKSSLIAKEIITNDIINIQNVVTKTSNYCKLRDIFIEIIGNLFYLRLSFFTDEASGHNMTTKAANEIGIYLKNKLKCNFLSVSGNFCVDKKNSSINGILGRGIKSYAEIKIPFEICKKLLNSDPEKIEKMIYYKNYIGSNLAGSIRSANAHFANIIAGFYIATGQDVANVIEGSQGFTFAKIEDKHLFFSITIPNLIIGSVGNGKDYDFINENIKKMKILSNDNLSQKFAIILTAAVLCSELSLLAALTNENELIDSHIKYERRH